MTSSSVDSAFVIFSYSTDRFRPLGLPGSNTTAYTVFSRYGPFDGNWTAFFLTSS